MKQSIVTGMGEALWDMLPEGKKIGGAPANFAYHISQFGIDSRVVSAVGKDTAGSELLENLRDKSLKGLIERTDFPTGSVEDASHMFRFAGPTASRLTLHHPPVS